MRRVILESPFSSHTAHNLSYARKALLDCLKRGESPIASHVLLTQVLDDSDAEQRALGIDAGHAWIEAADAVVVYTDLGISAGMRLGMERARASGRPVELRSLFVTHAVNSGDAKNGEQYAGKGPHHGDTIAP
jgi:hypothetical protein